MSSSLLYKLLLRSGAVLICWISCLCALEYTARNILNQKKIPFRIQDVERIRPSLDAYRLRYSRTYHHVSNKELHLLAEINANTETFDLILGDSWIHLAFKGSKRIISNGRKTYVIAQPGWSPMIYRSILSAIKTDHLGNVLVFLNETDPGDDACRYRRKISPFENNSYAIDGSLVESSSTLFYPDYSTYLLRGVEPLAIIKLSKILLLKSLLNALYLPNMSKCGTHEIFAWQNDSTGSAQRDRLAFISVLSDLQRLSSRKQDGTPRLILTALSESVPPNKHTVSELCSTMTCPDGIHVEPLIITNLSNPVDTWGHLSSLDYQKLRHKILDRLR